MARASEKTYFITFEGIDLCGKDTQLHRFASLIRDGDRLNLGNKYSNIWITSEPTKITNAGREISRAIYSGGLSGEEAARLFITDRLEHSKVIRDVLSHSHVLCGRYDISTLAYQTTQGMDFCTLYKMHNFGGGGCLVPDMTLVFGITYDVAMQRKALRDKALGIEVDGDFYEKSEFQRKLVDNLQIVIDRLRENGRSIIIIDGDQSIDDVTEEMIRKVNLELNS